MSRGVGSRKKFESGMVVNPLTIHPEAKLVDALTLMKEHAPFAFHIGRESGNSAWASGS